MSEEIEGQIVFRRLFHPNYSTDYCFAQSGVDVGKGCFVCDQKITDSVDVIRIYKLTDKHPMIVHLECAVSVVFLCLNAIEVVLGRKQNLPKGVTQLIMTWAKKIYSELFHDAVTTFAVTYTFPVVREGHVAVGKAFTKYNFYLSSF